MQGDLLQKVHPHQVQMILSLMSKDICVGHKLHLLEVYLHLEGKKGDLLLEFVMEVTDCPIGHVLDLWKS